MFKRMTLLRRRLGHDAGQFQAHWSRVHASFVLQLPGIRRYVQNDIVDARPAVEFSGIVELWFDDEAALRGAFESPAGRALPADEANFLGGKIVCDVEERVIVAADPPAGAAKLISFVRVDPVPGAAIWERWHAQVVASAARGIPGCVRLSNHRVASCQRVGSEAGGPPDLGAFVVHHFATAAARDRFAALGPAEALDLEALDPRARAVRVAVGERVLSPRMIAGGPE